MESIKDLEKRIKQMRDDMYESRYPEEFGLLVDTSFEVFGKTYTFKEAIDRNTYLLRVAIRENGFTFDIGEDLKHFLLDYLEELERTRINNYCLPGESWKEHWAAVKKSLSSKKEYEFGDNYSKHEMM